MSTKMVLRKQTGHICSECKVSFKAKELLIEHYETCSALKGIIKPTDAKAKFVGNVQNFIGTQVDEYRFSSESEALLIKAPDCSPCSRGNTKMLQPDECIYVNSVLHDPSNDVNENVDFSKTVTKERIAVKSAASNMELVSDGCIELEGGVSLQSGEQLVVSVVDVTNVEGFFDDDVCAFEEIVSGSNNPPDAAGKSFETPSLQQIKVDKIPCNSNQMDCNKKAKKRRLNSGSNSTCEVINNSSGGSGSNCNNPSVYSLCLAAEIASSMETVQAAKSLLGMSLQQGEVEAEDAGNVKMVSILRKKPEAVSQVPATGVENQVADCIKKELEEIQGPLVAAPALNVISKISFLQSLNNRIIGKESDGAELSALITTPVACDAKVKIEVDSDESFLATQAERKIAKLNFNVVRSSAGPNVGSTNSKMLAERQRNAVVSVASTKPIYFPQVGNQPNSFRGRQSIASGATFANQDAALMSVTNEVEVIAEVVKSEETLAFNNSIQSQQYVIQVPGNVTSVSGLLTPRGQVAEAKDSKLYVCGLCNKAFDDCEAVKLHVEKHVGMERQNSSKVKNSEEKLSDDESGGDDDGDDGRRQPGVGFKHECRECGVQFPRLSSLKKHAKAEHGGLKAYVCGACNKTFPFACGLKLHALTHGAERKYSCQFCGRRFKHASNLQKHIKVVHVNACKCRTVECTCGKRDPSSFKIDHACRICGRVCESSKHLEIHHRSHTGEKPEVCQICGKSFQHKSNLQKHQLKHTGIRPYKCPHCERSFFVKHSYLGHMRLHTRDSPYTCETCGKSFISKNGLQVHSILHQDRLPFRCGQCDREFAQLGNLNKHLSLHTGDKPFPCSYCEKKFVDTSALKRHMVIHTRERNYSCPECGKTFLHFSSLRSHMSTHKFEEQERHQCNICSKTFTVKSNYIRHMKQHEETQETQEIEYLVYMQ